VQEPPLRAPSDGIAPRERPEERTVVERILLGQLGANGDCLYATILARQLRHDHPKAHITWAISSQCAGLLKNNPDIDEIWQIPIAGWEQHETIWRVFEREAMRSYVERSYDFVLLSQIWPNNFRNFDGTVRPSILRSYGRPITVPIENVIRLTPEEIAHVERFGLADGALDRQRVGAATGTREDRGRPRAAADRHPHPHGTEAPTGSASQVTDLLGCLGRQADEGPAVGASGIPDPQLGIENDNHDNRITRGSDNAYMVRHAGAADVRATPQVTAQSCGSPGSKRLSQCFTMPRRTYQARAASASSVRRIGVICSAT